MEIQASGTLRVAGCRAKLIRDRFGGVDGERGLGQVMTRRNRFHGREILGKTIAGRYQKENFEHEKETRQKDHK